MIRSPIPAQGAIALRRWQAEALPLALSALDEARAGLIQACTGAGKSILLAELCAQRPPAEGEAVVISTPTQQLVEQLYRTLSARLGAGWVGRYYTRRKESAAPFVVTCHPSAADLAMLLAAGGRTVRLWIADEAHKTESPEMHAAAELLAPVARIGCTATPFRSERGGRLRLWEEVLYTYTPGDALRDGVIVPWRIVPWEGAEQVPVDDALLEMIAATEGPGVCNARTCDGADEFAERLVDAGIPAAGIHSRLSARVREERLDQLRRGELRVLVYPSLLSEGFDMPELRWMALRRPVKARVRFIQELGRVLRTAPGKTEAAILDPLGLIEEHSLTYEAALGWVEDLEPEAGEEAEETEEDRAVEEQELFARPLDIVASWARQLAVAAVADRIAKAPRHDPEAAAERRRGPATPAQLDYLSKLRSAARRLPPSHARAIEAVIDRSAIGSAGMASDLIDVLAGLRSRSRNWAPPPTVQPPPLDTISGASQAVSEGGWSAAGVTRRDGELVAIAVYKGRRRVRCDVRPWPGASMRAAMMVAVAVAAEIAAADGEDRAVVAVQDDKARGMVAGGWRVSGPAETAALRRLSRASCEVAVRDCPAWKGAWSALARAERQNKGRAAS